MTIQLALLATIVDLVLGFPFAYILVRRVRYRDIVRALMVFPMFGALYVTFGIGTILLPGGLLAPLLDALWASRATSLLFSLPSVVFAMSIFTFPFMVMSIGTALSNVDPTLEEAAACLGAGPFADVPARRPAAGPVGGRRGLAAGLRLEHRRVRGAALLGGLHEQRSLAVTIYDRGVVQNDYGLVVRDGHRAAGSRVRRDVLLAALLARSPRGMTARVDSAATSRPVAHRPRVTARRLTAVAQPRLHLALPVPVRAAVRGPAVALVRRAYGGSAGLENYRGAIGDFSENLFWSVRITAWPWRSTSRSACPAAYALVRYPVPGRRIIFSILQLSLYVPGAVIGLALLLTYTFTYHAVSMWGLVLAMAVGTFPLMLTPIVVALKDLPPEFEEAARCLGATGWQTYRKIVFPLIGPGVSAGLLLCFIIVFNEYLVTLFVHPVDIETAPLRIFNLQKTGGLSPATAALAVTMQLVSFAAVLVFFRVFGTRHFKGTYIL